VTAVLFRSPGWWRALTYTVIGAGFGYGLVVVLRLISGLPAIQTEQTGYPQVIVASITASLGFLIGIGCFDYWFRWAVGAPTFPKEREHENHGAYSWRDYFKVNTDHKVIGIQYLCTTFFFFFVGGLIAMIMRAELAQPGTQIVDPSTFNSLFSTHAALMIFVFVIPAFAGIANYVLPLMIGAPDMAFPRLNALSFWMLPVAGLLFLGSYLAPGGAFDAGWTGYAPLSTGAPLGQSFFNLGVQFAGASSIATGTRTCRSSTSSPAAQTFFQVVDALTESMNKTALAANTNANALSQVLDNHTDTKSKVDGLHSAWTVNQKLAPADPDGFASPAQWQSGLNAQAQQHMTAADNVINEYASTLVVPPVIPVWEDWRAYAGHNLYFVLGCNRRHLFRALGSLAMPELFDVDRDEAVVRGMRRLGFQPDQDFEFFVNHMEGDADHGPEWLDGVVLPAVRAEPDAGLELAQGGALRMLAMRRYNEYLATSICGIDVKTSA